MNPDNTREGPCYYCDKLVLKGVGRMSDTSRAIWHKECVGSGRHEGAYHYSAYSSDETMFGEKSVSSTNSAPPRTTANTRSPT